MLESLLIAKYPTLFHMTEEGTWPSIRKLGLLSSEALLDHLGTGHRERDRLLGSFRHTSESLNPEIRLRDQKPMVQNLERCLPSDISVEDWLRFLNRKVFFWTNLDRLMKLRSAYSDQRHLILEVSTARMLDAHRDKISLCHMNSGAVRFPKPPRDYEIFQPAASFPFSSRKKPVEFTIDYSVPDIAALVTKVYEEGGGSPESTLYSESKS